MPTNDEIHQVNRQSASRVSLYENRAALQYAGRGRSMFFGSTSYLNINPRADVQEVFFFLLFFLPKPQKSLRKTRQCYTIPPRSLSYWTPARCECELSTRQHLFSEPLCPFSVLHVVRPLNPKKKMKRLRFLCFGFVMMIYSLI